MIKFKYLEIGQTFAFFRPSIFSQNKRFVKLSGAHYQEIAAGQTCGDVKTVGTSSAAVTDVKTETVMNLAAMVESQSGSKIYVG